MKMLRRLVAVASAAFFIAGSALAQNAGAVSNHAIVVGKGVELAHGIEKLTWANGSGTRKDNGMVTIYCAAAPDA